MDWRVDDAYGTCMLPAREIVGANLRALIKREKQRRGRLNSFQAIEDAIAELGLKVGRSTVDRMSKGTTDFEIGNLEAVARVFEIEVWQLMVPSFNPENLPVLRSVGEAEEDVYRKMREFAKQLANIEDSRPESP